MSKQLVRVQVGDKRHARFPFVLCIFYNDTAHWVAAHVNPQITWFVLLEHLLAVLGRDPALKLSRDPGMYSVFDMREEEMLSMSERVMEFRSGQVLYIHESEFVNAYDRDRRAALVADMLMRATTEEDGPAAAREV